MHIPLSVSFFSTPRRPNPRQATARRIWRRGWSAGALVALLLTSASCNSDRATTTGGPPTGLPTGSFDIGVPAALAVRRGASTILEVTIARSGFVAPVFVTVTGLPTGVTGPSISSTSTNQIRLTLSADMLATLGPATATVTAQGSEVPSVTKQFVLTVGQ